MRSVDPRFPATLRRLRHSLGLSLRDLARLAYLGKSTVSELETGRRSPSLDTARHLDGVLGAGGVLAAMVSESRDERIAYVLAHPTRLDAAAVDALAAALAVQRRLDDALDAHVMLGWVGGQRDTVAQLARDARGPHTPRLYAVAAEWTQFAGWLLAEARRDPDAARMLGVALQEAQDLGDGVLVAQAANFRGYLERQRGNPRGIVRHFLAAYETPGASTLQRVGDAVQAAHGLALMGDVREARRLLGEASDLADTDDPPPATAYWLSPTFCRMGIGLALSALGDRAAAADHLSAGLHGLPPDQRDAEWTGEYREVLARL